MRTTKVKGRSSISDDGQALVGTYEQRMAVRAERTSIAQAERIKSEEEALRRGRQTSPEIAALASRYVRTSNADIRSADVTALARDIRSMAAALLGQVSE